MIFQSTHPSGVRRRTLLGPGRLHADFNPRTPVGCDGLTTCRYRWLKYFNPRTPVGCDLRLSANRRVMSISIHAPQWGATDRRRLPSTDRIISIHAPQWGATRCGGGAFALQANFNPRTPVGCDCLGAAGATRASDFNPRTPVGCDGPDAGEVQCLCISIHAPQWGATENCIIRPPHLHISIHAPQWGATEHQAPT